MPACAASSPRTQTRFDADGALKSWSGSASSTGSAGELTAAFRPEARPRSAARPPGQRSRLLVLGCAFSSARSRSTLARLTAASRSAFCCSSPYAAAAATAAFASISRSIPFTTSWISKPMGNPSLAERLRAQARSVTDQQYEAAAKNQYTKDKT